jgi:hypothetical protein
MSLTGGGGKMSGQGVNSAKAFKIMNKNSLDSKFASGSTSFM